ncbi:hypothetical protein CAEBREN_10404 [Caenorhabditis brenneri]|uniref:Uncharacterized protein n=1 Tax=Caenorhabditis brenneri TaxID=135651 RepID=G0MFJ9_CAEBE|nr:hypothetical protein CAEBREN_10404 [Caenorhabditis brenneri]
MHPSAAPQMGPAGPYHHPMPPQQVPYHAEQVPTTSHPSWHHPAYPGLPTPPYQQYPPQQPQQHANYPPMTPHHPHPTPQQQQQQPPPQPPPQQHSQMTPQALTQQQQQQIQQQQQQRSAYSSPSHSIGPTAPPAQNQKLRTEQWAMGQSWPYAQSPAPSVAPSVMSYHQNDDRMSMLSVNTNMTNQYPETQRCFSSNGSTCENVNPEMTPTNWANAAEQAMKEWFNQHDPHRRFQLAMTIREWVRRDRFMRVDSSVMPGVVQHLLNIVHDGMIIRPQVQLPQSYYTQLYCYLLDILLRITYYRTTVPYMNLVVQLFVPKENGPQDFRELICQMLRYDLPADSHAPHCSRQAFLIFENIIQHLNNPKNEAMRLDFSRALKFEAIFNTLRSYFVPSLPPTAVQPIVLMILRFLASKDPAVKNYLIWPQDPKREQLSNGSLIIGLLGVLGRSHQALITLAAQEGEREKKEPVLKQLTQVITRAFDLLNLLMHDSNSIDQFVNANGVAWICKISPHHNIDVARSGFKLLLHVSDAKALSLINLKDILPNIIVKVRECLRNNELKKNEEDDVVYCGTGFLSNAIAHKQPVKEMAIEYGTIGLLYEVIMKYTPLNELRETLRRNLVCGIISNSLRTLNNFLMMWIPTQNEPAVNASENVMQQIRNFTQDVLKRLVTCLSIEGVDTPPMLELRSTILRFFLLVLRTPFVPDSILLSVTDDIRKKNVVDHICIAFSWAMGQTANERTQDTKLQLVERVFNLLVRLIHQCGAAREVALSFYGVHCPLSLLSNNQQKPSFVLNVLIVCDQVLMHNPSVANVWSVDRPMLEMLKNHLNPDIVKAASSLLSKLPDIDPLAVILSNS